MFNLADLFVFILFLYYAVTGWRRGFWLSALGPVASVGCIFFAFRYFQASHNIFLSLAIALFGPVALRLVIGTSLRFFREVTGDKKRPLILSSAVGSLLSIAWGGMMTAIMVFMMAISPDIGFNFSPVKKAVRDSQTFSWMSRKIEAYWPEFSGQKQTTKADVTLSPATAAAVIVPTPEDRAKIEVLEEYQNLMQDDRILNMIEDPKVLEMIQAKDYSALMNDEKFTKVLADPQLILQLLQLYRKMGGQMPAGGDNVPASGSRSITIQSFSPGSYETQNQFAQ
jgi:hypothetical protein